MLLEHAMYYTLATYLLTYSLTLTLTLRPATSCTYKTCSRLPVNHNCKITFSFVINLLLLLDLDAPVFFM